MQYNSLLPELYITNFEVSINFYTKILAFKIEYARENPKFAFLSYQNSQIMIQELREGEKESEQMERPFGRGTNFQIETDSIQKIIDSAKSHNYSLKREIRDSWYKANFKEYGCREILILDPDGYLFRFSQSLGERIVKD